MGRGAKRQWIAYLNGNLHIIPKIGNIYIILLKFENYIMEIHILFQKRGILGWSDGLVPPTTY